jgi:hypothetical protein
MALPKLETPTYETIIPSNGRSIEYRPFLVKEEKILMMAQESQDTAQAINALKKIISSCTFGKVDPNELTTYDAEFLFLQLRIKSVGESVDFQIKCADADCSEMTDVTVDLTQVEVILPEKEVETNIKLNDSIGMTLKEVTLKDAVGLSGKDMDDITGLVSTVIDTIYDEEKVYNVKDVSKQELSSFIDSLNHNQLEIVTQFIQNQPAIKKDIKYKCKKCGKQNCIEMKGLQDFFA